MIALPTIEEVREGHRKYQEKEPREAMYRTASFLVGHFWGRPRDIADSLGVLLLTWISAFYRQGAFDFSKLEEVIASEQALLKSFRDREILTYSSSERPSIAALFVRFLGALQLCEGKNRGTGSPAAVGHQDSHCLSLRLRPTPC
jgi:hypothetical protein